MSSRSERRRAFRRGAALAVAVVLLAVTAIVPRHAAAVAPRPLLRVCADPNNLPFSNAREEGFENRIAVLVARDLGADLRYTWWAQRRGFVRESLGAGACDLLVGTPSTFTRVLATRPYYRSTYLFVSRRDRALDIRSFDDPALRRLRIGVQIIGADYASTPPAHALARRGLVDNVAGYTVCGDYARPDPPARIMDAVARGEVDIAVVWGPLAGYFAQRSAVPLVLTPVSPAVDPPALPFVYDISMGVGRGNDTLRARVQEVLERRRGEIDSILDAYGVPRVDVGRVRTEEE
jgi:mxaJ protein